MGAINLGINPDDSKNPDKKVGILLKSRFVFGGREKTPWNRGHQKLTLKTALRIRYLVKGLLRDDPHYQETFLKEIRGMEGCVARIQSRGEKVIFVKFPIGGDVRTTNDRALPR